MHILNDFFLLSWNENSQSIQNLPDEFSQKIYKTYDDYKQFCDSCSILFVINSENLQKIIKLDEFKLIFGSAFEKKLVDKCLILQFQKKVLEFIIELGDMQLTQTLKTNFEILRKEGIITYYVSRRLIGLFGLIKEKSETKVELELKVAKSDKNFYKHSKNILGVCIENLKQCINLDIFESKLKQIDKKLQDERFSIGVTGIINAGKSTMLNALLGEEILGTAVVPETANLTILKYAKEGYATVNFWSKDEFDRIQNSAQDIASIKKFISETKNHFKNDLSKYIQTQNRSQKVDIKDLSLYTSAEKSNKKCNLVKSVELYSDLEFLKDGVEIVDTPGLDDPIIQREEITLKYVSECDLMIHLMNVNQSATKKDVDFIIDSILYQNIARLLIVITRIDTVSKEELEEVITYTKNSIEKRLIEQNRSYKLKLIINKLDFIPISGKMALLLKTSRADEARKQGYNLENSGILQIQEYLNSVLFGSKSEKANLIIQSNQNELYSIIEQNEKILDEEEMLLSKSAMEIKKEFELHKTQRTKILEDLKVVKKSIKSQENELREYFKTLHIYSQKKLISLKDIIKTRVMDDVSYEIRKNKKLPQKQRVQYMVELGLKDGLIDLVRDYRYEFQKKMQISSEIIQRSFKDKIKSDDYKNQEFDAQEFFDKQFKSFTLFQNRDILLVKIYDLIQKYAKNSLEKLDINLDKILQVSIDELQKLLSIELLKTDEELLLNFLDINRQRVQRKEYKVKIKDDLLTTSMQTIKKSNRDKKQRLQIIRSKKEALSKIKEEINHIKKSEK
ncbi:MAG: dynamin family protein [Campylobacteraceae bacterium]|nr:dynamin family protein [Campylobacteraceae bacterium]